MRVRPLDCRDASENFNEFWESSLLEAETATGPNRDPRLHTSFQDHASMYVSVAQNRPDLTFWFFLAGLVLAMAPKG